MIKKNQAEVEAYIHAQQKKAMTSCYQQDFIQTPP